MSDRDDLSRFREAQQRSFETALREIQNGKKQSHWMWYIFPQMRGLGFSEISVYYGIRDMQEAKDYLADPYLRGNLETICQALLELPIENATAVFGRPDDMKLRSSMTLFSCASEDDPLYQLVLDKFYGGRADQRTLHILGIRSI